MDGGLMMEWQPIETAPNCDAGTNEEVFMYSNQKKMCYTNRYERFERGEATEEMERTPSGALVPVTRYSDGTSTVNWGGPCGSVNYDKYGNEC